MQTTQSDLVKRSYLSMAAFNQNTEWTLSPSTLRDVVVASLGEKLGFFCEILLEPSRGYTPHFISCECEVPELCEHANEIKQNNCEERARFELYKSEHDFTQWKKKLYDFHCFHCPYKRYEGHYGANYVYVSIPFYIRHCAWIEQQWMQVTSHDGLAELLLRSGDVESNPGPMPCENFFNEQLLRQKIEALERKRQRKAEKVKTVRRKIKVLIKELRNQNFEFQMKTQDVKELLENPTIQRATAYAAANFVAPGVGTAAATVIEGAKVLNATDNVRSAAEKLAQTCSFQIPELLRTHADLAEVATTTLTNINTLTTQLQSESGLLSSIGKLAQNLTSSVSVLALVITVILCLAAMAWDWKLGCAVIMLVLVYFNWPVSVIEKIKKLCGSFGWHFQMNIGDHIPIIGQIIFTLLAFFGVSKIPADKFYDNLLSRLDKIPKAFSGVYKIWDQAGKMFEMVSDEFKIYFLGAQREDLLLEKGMTDEVNEWVERVKFYLDAQQRNALARDEESVREVETLFNKMYRWKHTPHLWKAMSSECQRVITSVTPMVNELFKFACRSTVHEGGPRKAPLAIFFSGDSGRGKSEMLYPLAFSLLANRGFDMKNARNEIYVRNYETEYWDGYVGQKIAFFDDAFQMRDSLSNPSPEFMEAIRLINTAPAHVHCADLNDKGRFFSSEICIYTTNLKEKFSSYINSINCPEAAMRRLNANAYRIRTNPAFEKVVKIGNRSERRLDTEKIANCPDCEALYIAKGLERKLKFCPHVQIFDRYDLITDEILQSDMSYKDLVKQLKEFDSTLVQDEESKLYMYEKLIEDPFIFEIGDEPYYDASDLQRFGPIDFAIPTDVVNYNALLAFCLHLQNLGIHDLQIMESEIAAHEPLWNTYQRLEKYGTVHADRRDDSLQQAMDSAEIAYNFEAQMFHSRRNLSFSFKRVYNSFKKYVADLCDQISWVWQNAGLAETLGFIQFGLVFLSLSALAYKSFTAYKCPVCKEDDCECVRVTDEGYTYKGTVYAFDQFELECNQLKPRLRVESDVRPLIKQQQNLRVESDVKPLVNQQQNLRVESDIKPSTDQRPQSLRIESDVRPLINQQHQGMCVESDVRPLVNHQQNLRVEGQFAFGQDTRGQETFEMYRDQGCEMLETKILNNSLYLLHDDVKPYGNVLFIKGTCFLMNYHYIEILKRTKPQNYVFALSNRSRKMAEITLEDIMQNHVRLEKNGQLLDAVIVYLCPVRNKISPHVNLEKLFVKTEDLSLLNGSYEAQLPTYNSRVDDICMSKRSLHEVKMSHNTIKIDDQNIKMEINYTWQYGGSTSGGDCGAPVILNNNGAQRKIVGIHMASNGYIGVAQTITQESLKEAFSQVDLRYQNYVEIDIACQPILGDEPVVGSVPMNHGLMVHGVTNVPVISGNSSKIVPSKLFDYVPHKTIPAKLRATKECDPMLNGLIKYGKTVPRIEPRYIELAVNDVKNNFILNESFRDMSDYTRVLTYEEAVLGVQDDEFMAPINRGTSMGYPYANQEKLRGKRDAFGDDEWDLNSPLALRVKQDVETLIDNCRKGIQTGVYWSDTLKDERRPIEKVQAGKTRVFCGGPVHFTIAFRKYFLGFAAWLMHNRNANEVSVGTNVYSPDWNEIVKKLASRAMTRMGMNVVAGDFSNFDGSLSSQILWAILDAINEWYDDGPENAQIRRTLWMHIVHAIHINRDIVYQATHSQPSGCPITAILNSIYNSIIIRIAYLICAEQHYRETGEDYCAMRWFNLFVAMVSYGDDNLIGVSEKILVWFNQLSLTKALLVIGHEYTDEAKTGVIVPVRDISEVAYLKRSFKWHPALNRYVAPLDLDVVLEIVQWTKRGLSYDAITIANLDVTMRELSLHDSEIFDKYKKILMQECVKHKIQYRFMTQLEYLASVSGEPLLVEVDHGFVLRASAKKLPKNYIYLDRTQRELCVDLENCDMEVLKRKLSLFCYYRKIDIKHVSGVPENLLEFIYHF